MMVELSISIDAGSGADFGELEAESIIDALSAYAPVVSYGHGTMTARFNVVGDTVQDAINRAVTLFNESAPVHDIYHVEASIAESVDQEATLTPIA